MQVKCQWLWLIFAAKIYSDCNISLHQIKVYLMYYRDSLLKTYFWAIQLQLVAEKKICNDYEVSEICIILY